MARPIVIGYHLIWMTYGSWMPNDPRGSTSHQVCTQLLQDLGELHFGRKKIQPIRGELLEFKRERKRSLSIP